MKHETGLSYARQKDTGDPLAHYRDEFHLPLNKGGTPLVYFCGHSLGLQPKSAAGIVEQEMEDWRRLGVYGHFSGTRPWLSYHEQLTEMTASLVGAEPAEIVSMNTLTVNLHLLMVSFYRPTRERHKILIESPTFPSDRYAVESQIKWHGFDPREALLLAEPRDGEALIRSEDLESLIDRHGDSIALILLPGVQYYTGQVFDMPRIVQLGHKKGCVVGFDLAHGAGNLELALHDWDADFAVWCSYKYLNGGPGAVAACFVNARYARSFDIPRFAGWWGHDKDTRFQMGPEFHAIPGAEGWQLSNPAVLSMAPVLASLEIFESASMEALVQKSRELTGYLEFLVGEYLDEQIEILTPDNPARRGCQLSLRVKGEGNKGQELFGALENNGVVCDWREPDVIRAAPVPLYNRFEEVFQFVEILRQELAAPGPQ